MTHHVIQAYRQAPWRIQIQWIMLFLLGLTLIAFIAGIYLSVSARAATTGREIQGMESESETIERQIADLESQLALLTSAAQMQKRAKDLGFEVIQPGTEIYLKIPGYTGRQPAVLAPPPGPGMVAVPLIRPNYTQSLWEWLFQGFLNSPLGKSQVQP
jgi:cell division protein FtsB